MKYQRALVVTELLADVSPALGALHRAAPALQHVLIVATAPAARAAFGGHAPDTEAANQRALDALRDAARAVAPSCDVDIASKLEVASLVLLALDAGIDLLVDNSRTLHEASVLSEAQKRLGLPVLWPTTAATPKRRVERVLCVPLGRAGRASLAAFLRDQADPSLRATLFSAHPLTADEVAMFAEISGIRARLEVPDGNAPLRRLLTDPASLPEHDLLVVTRIPVALLLGITWATPILVLPPPAQAAAPSRALDVPDAIDDRGTLRLRVSYEAVVGSLSTVDATPLAFISGGRVVATTTTSRCGEAELAVGPDMTSLGVTRLVDVDSVEALAAIERRVRIIRPGSRPLVVFDSELDDESLRLLRRLHADSAELVAVRLRPTRNVRAIRDHLHVLQLAAPVVDARAVLDEGPAFDVSDALGPVRLMRVAARLQRAGFTIAGVLARGFTDPQTPASPGAEPIEGNRVELELDNALARSWLLEAIGSSQRTLHLQVYMVADDDFARAVVDELGAAGARGVAVRVLVDSLHALHGSFGAENPVLTRLSKYPGVELRLGRPMNELPSLEALKQRDHRKIVITDGRLGLLGGRNLSNEYYRGFDQVAINASSPWREVPWLDAGARVFGAAVTALETAFLDAWTQAGGAPFAVAPAEPAGTTRVRVVVHHGLRSARTLEAYRDLIEGARSHIHLVNAFPLLLELQHVLLRAQARGVAVRVLTGHAAPTHSGQAFTGSWSAARVAATELVHSRLDPLVEAGCEVYALAKRDVPGWDAALGVVHPNVHAKVLSVDGERCAVGSANFDVTASYWESELVLVIEDPAPARELEAKIGALIVGSTRWNRDDPVWQRLAARRTWMRHWPGVLTA